LDFRKKGIIMRDHTKLKAFEIADSVVMEVYRVTRSFPKEEIFGLTSQVRRSAMSIASNIVEGCARNSEADYLRFLDMSYGSAKELEYQLSVADRLGYSTELQLVRDKTTEAARVLNALINSIRRSS
jgi:four helix bundle protein